MACTPKQMGEAILRNLEAKTGHPLAHWQQLLHAASITDKKEAISFLKQVHGLGHFQAQKVFEANSASNAYADESALLANLFDTPGRQQSYRVLQQFMLNLGPDVKAKPCKTYLPFYAKKQFVLLQPQKDMMVVGLALPDQLVQPSGLKAAKTLGSQRINWQFSLSLDEPLSQEQKSLIEQAYQNQAQ